MIGIIFIIIGIINLTISFFVRIKQINMDLPKGDEEEDNNDIKDIKKLTEGTRSTIRWIGGVFILIGIIIYLGGIIQ